MRYLPLVPVHEDVSCVRRVPLFSGLTQQQQDLVGTLSRPMEFFRGEIIQRAGEPANSLAVVHTGQVKLSRTMPSGRERLLRVLGPGETMGEHGFLTREESLEQAAAGENVRLCVFSYDDLADLIGKYPDIAFRMMRRLGERLAEAERGLALSTLDVDTRVADYLLELPVEGAAKGEIKVRLPLSKKDIASLLGTTPESLSRALGRLTARGLVSVAGQVVTLIDPQGLENLVDEA